MKIPPHCLLAGALLIMMVWLVSQFQTLRNLEADGAILRSALSEARIGLDSKRAGTAIPEDNWQGIARRLVRSRGVREIDARKAELELGRRFSTFAAEDYERVMDEMDALDFAPEERNELERRLIASFAEKFPACALERLADRLKGPHEWEHVLPLCEALERLARSDPATAIKWFDEVTAAGSFDAAALNGINLTRINMESYFLRGILGSQPEAAKGRILELPPESRTHVLRAGVDWASPKAYVSLIREVLPVEEQAGFFHRMASEIQNYDTARNFMAAIHPSAEERRDLATAAAGKIFFERAYAGTVAKEDVEDLRNWLALEAPGSEDRMTGSLLASSVAASHGKVTYEVASELVLHYHRTTASEQLVVAFLQELPQHGSFQRGEVMPLIGRIGSHELRDQLLSRFQ